MGELDHENLWGYAKRLRFVQEVIEESFQKRAPSTLRVLDVGCGNGSFLALPLARQGYHVTGIDVDEHSIEHARQLAGAASNARFWAGLVEEIPDEELFDVVILSEVLEHLTEPATLLEASMRQMAEGGVLIVTVPNGYGEFELDSWLFRVLRMQRVVNALARHSLEVASATDNHESGHVQFFTRRRLSQLFEQCGLKVFRERGSVLFAGPFVGLMSNRFPSFIEWNARITDRLPISLSSGWYFALRRQ